MDKPKKLDIPIKLPPLRTQKEWREIMRMKIKSYEMICDDIMVRRTPKKISK